MSAVKKMALLYWKAWLCFILAACVVACGSMTVYCAYKLALAIWNSGADTGGKIIAIFVFSRYPTWLG